MKELLIILVGCSLRVGREGRGGEQRGEGGGLVGCRLRTSKVKIRNENNIIRNGSIMDCSFAEAQKGPLFPVRATYESTTHQS